MKKLTTIILLMMCSTLHAQREVFLASSPASNQLKTDNFYFEPDTTFYIFLAFGQSNMVGDAKPEDCDYKGQPQQATTEAACERNTNGTEPPLH